MNRDSSGRTISASGVSEKLERDFDEIGADLKKTAGEIVRLSNHIKDLPTKRDLWEPIWMPPFRKVISKLAHWRCQN